MSWQKFRPQAIAWQTQGDVSERVITTLPATLKQIRLESEQTWHGGDSKSHLILIAAGTLAAGGQPGLNPGDLVWLPAGSPFSAAAQAGTTLIDLALPGNPGPTDSACIRSKALPWESFDDPAGRPTQPVQLLLESEKLAVLRTRFVPEYSAGEHWHDFDTWYFITEGNMRFGHEGIYETGDVRQVSGGYSYGPEEPGSDGVEFVLVSVGGGVALHWADLEPAPNGKLP